MPLLIISILYGHLTLPKSLPHIQTLKPKINIKYSLTLSSTIDRVTEKYNLNPTLFTAIIFQESSFRLNAQGGNDFGLGQINFKTGEHYCPQIDRLLVDMHYNLDCSAKILADFKKWYGKKEKNWWTRYNSSSKVFRERYEKRVNYHKEKISE